MHKNTTSNNVSILLTRLSAAGKEVFLYPVARNMYIIKKKKKKKRSLQCDVHCWVYIDTPMERVKRFRNPLFSL